MIAEWAFLKGEIKSEAELMTLSLKVFLTLNKNQLVTPSRLGRASVAIFSDLLPVFKKLSYGGRKPSDIPTGRAVLLLDWIHKGQFSQLAA